MNKTQGLPSGGSILVNRNVLLKDTGEEVAEKAPGEDSRNCGLLQ